MGQRDATDVGSEFGQPRPPAAVQVGADAGREMLDQQRDEAVAPAAGVVRDRGRPDARGGGRPDGRSALRTLRPPPGRRRPGRRPVSSPHGERSRACHPAYPALVHRTRTRVRCSCTTHKKGTSMLSTLPRHLNGHVLTPQDAAYDEARTVFAAHVDRRPALIVRVEGPNDVAQVIAHARETGCELAVRSGGHSPAGHGVSDGGIVIDLSELRSFELDAAERTAWAGAGLTAGEYTVRGGRARARDRVRRHRLRRDRWHHARRRHWLSRAQARADHRRPACGGDRHRGRAAATCGRADRARSVLGASRRRRQLRRRYAPEVPAPPCRRDSRRPALPPRDARSDRRLRRGGRRGA